MHRHDNCGGGWHICAGQAELMQRGFGATQCNMITASELYVTLQEEWQIPLDDSTASADLTVDDLARAVAALLGEPGPGRGAA